jgi:aminoglycoside phosphotransferase (APT) family kinase protein
MINPAALDRLLEALRTVPGYDRARLAGPPEPMHGGFWAATTRLHLAGVDPAAAELVLRVMPDDAAAAKETVIHQGVVAQGYPAPTIRLAGTRDLGLGGPFLLMDVGPGRPLLADLDGPAALRRLPSVVRALPAVLGDAMATLHRLDPRPIRDALIELRGTAAWDADAVLGHLVDAATRSGVEDLVAPAAWLDRHRPATHATAVCHGDLHPFNILTDRDRWCVLDWTGALIADPAYDVAFTGFLVSHPPLHAPGLLRPVIAAGGRHIGRRFLHEYEQRAGVEIDRRVLAWYTTLHALRMALDLERWRRDGSIAERSGHPWLALEPVIRHALATPEEPAEVTG